MTNRTFFKAGLVTVAFALVAAASSQAFINHENRFTFSAPVALPGVVLPAGQYSFDVASDTALDVVVVREPRSGKVLYMGFTTTVLRPKALDKETIIFGEASAREPRPIATWYEMGNTIGHQFLYR